MSESQPVQYATTPDGYRIAFRVAGSGSTLVQVPAIWHHLEVRDETQQVWRLGLQERFNLVEYDSRGQGLSTRGLPDSFSMTDLVTDLETVMDRLAIENAVLSAVGTSAHTAIRYSALHPDRVRALVLISASLVTGPWWPTNFATADWDNFLRLVASAHGSLEAAQLAKQRLAHMANQQDTTKMFEASQASRIDSELGMVQAPCLLLHPRDVQRPSLADCAELTSRLPNARLAETEGGWVMIQGDFDSSIALIESFLSELPDPSPHIQPPAEPLAEPFSVRELEVLRLLAAGLSNDAIAEQLSISPNTVRRHVSNILDKTGLANRTQAAVYARDRHLI